MECRNDGGDRGREKEEMKGEKGSLLQDASWYVLKREIEEGVGQWKAGCWLNENFFVGVKGDVATMQSVDGPLELGCLVLQFCANYGWWH
jgi:hypothetical protein